MFQRQRCEPLTIVPPTLLPVTREALHARRGVGVRGNRGSAAPVPSEVLARCEAEAGDVGPRADRAAVDRRSERKAGILDDGEAVPPGNRAERRQIRRVTVEVYRQDRGRPRRDSGVDLHRIDVAGIGLDVDPDRGSAGMVNRCRRSDVAVRRRDDLIAAPDAEGEQRNLECGRAGVRADAVTYSQPLGERGLEGRYLRAPIQPPARQYPQDRRIKAGWKRRREQCGHRRELA